MKLFLDTADTELIEKHFQTDLIDGITTNPTLIMKSGRDPEEVYQQLIDMGIDDISMEVVGDFDIFSSTSNTCCKGWCKICFTICWSS